MNLRARFAASLGTLLVLFAPTQEATALQTPTPAPCTPTFRFDSSNYSVTEEQGIVTLTVLRECIGAATTINYSSSNGSAVTGTDYTGVSGILNFGANDTSKTISVPILNDTVADSGETFTVSLSGSGITSPYQATVTISDGLPTVSISASPTSGSESSEPTAKFTVSLSEAPSSTVTVPISLGGTATRYGANIITDSSLESSTDRWWLNSENNKGTFTRAGEGAFFGSSGAKFSATTMDGWMIPSYKLDLDISTGGLAIQPYTLSFYARAEATRTLWAHIAGINSLDLMADLGNVTVTPTWKRYTITFTPLHNGAAPSHYPNLRFSAFADDLPLTLYIDGLKLEPGSSASKFGDYEFFGKNLISNSDLESAATNWYLNSGGGDPAFSRVNTAAYSGSYSAKYSATTFGDWLIPTYLLWSDIHPDGLSTTDQYALSYYAKMDAARTLTGTIGNGNGSGVIAYFGEVEFGTTWKRYEYFFTPANNGAAPNYPGIKLEALSNDVPFTLYWDKLQLQKITPQTSVTFAAGETVQVLEMPVIDDRIFEAGETIIVDLDTPVGADRSATQGSATFTITNDEDPPTASFPTSSSSKSEGETASFTVALSHDNTEVNVSVPFSYSGTAVRNTDYLAPSNISIASGAISGTLEIDAAEDAIDEDNETAIATIGTSSTATLTIVDENPAPTVQLTASTATVNEDAQTIQVTAQLSTQSGKTVTVQYATASGTAASDEDFTLTTGTLTINPGQTSKNFSVPVTIDCKTESSETFSVSLSNPSNATLGATTSQTITITDGTPCARIEVTPAALVFPEHDITPGPSKPLGLVVRNLGNAALAFDSNPFEVTGANADDFATIFYGSEDALTLRDTMFLGEFPEGMATTPVSAGGSRELRIAFDPRSEGPKTAQIVFHTNAQNPAGATAALSGTGVDLLLAASGEGGSSGPDDTYPNFIDFTTEFDHLWNTFRTEIRPRNYRAPVGSGYDPLRPKLPLFDQDGFDGLKVTNRLDEGYASPPDYVNTTFAQWSNGEAPDRHIFMPQLADLLIKAEWDVSAYLDPLVNPSGSLGPSDVPAFRLRQNASNRNLYFYTEVSSRDATPTVAPVGGKKTFTTFFFADSKAGDGSLDLTSDYIIASFDQLSTAPQGGGKYGAVTGLNSLTVERIDEPTAKDRLDNSIAGFSVGSEGWLYGSYTPTAGENGGEDTRISFNDVPGFLGKSIRASDIPSESPRPRWGLAFWRHNLPALIPGKVYCLTATVSSPHGTSNEWLKIPEFRLRVNTRNFATVWGFQSTEKLATWAPTPAGTPYRTYFKVPVEGTGDFQEFNFDVIVGTDPDIPPDPQAPTPPIKYGVTLNAVSLQKLKDLPAVTMLTPDTSRVTPIFPTFKFNRLDEGPLMVTSYTLEVSNNSSFDGENGNYRRSREIPALGAGHAGETVALDWDDPLERGRAYYWRVRAHDVFDQLSSGTTSKQFKVGAGAQVTLGKIEDTTARALYDVDLTTGEVTEYILPTGHYLESVAFAPNNGDLMVLTRSSGTDRFLIPRPLLPGGQRGSGNPRELTSDIDLGIPGLQMPLSYWLTEINFSDDGVLWGWTLGQKVLAWIPPAGGDVEAPWGTNSTKWTAGGYTFGRNLAWRRNSVGSGHYLYGVSGDGHLLKFGSVVANHTGGSDDEEGEGSTSLLSATNSLGVYAGLDHGGAFGPDSKMVVPDVTGGEVLLYRFDPANPFSYEVAAIPIAGIGDGGNDWAVAISLDVTTGQLDGLFSGPGTPVVSMEAPLLSPIYIYPESHPVDVEIRQYEFKVRYPSNPPNTAPSFQLDLVSGTGLDSVLSTMSTTSYGYRVFPNFSALNIQGEAEYAVMVGGADRGHIRISNGAPSLSIDSTPKIVR